MQTMQMMNKTPFCERPRERCLEVGPSALSLRECIAVLIGSGPPGIGCMGLAHEVLSRPGGGLTSQQEEIAFFASLEIAGCGYLKNIKGLGPSGQAKIQVAFEIAKRYYAYRSQKISASLPEKKAMRTLALKKIPRNFRIEAQEWLAFIPYDSKGNLGDFALVEKGVRTHLNVDPKELFARILPLRPKGIYLFHNHPSGRLIPSIQDISLTEKIKEHLHFFEIHFLGHGIIAAEGESWID